MQQSDPINSCRYFPMIICRDSWKRLCFYVWNLQCISCTGRCSNKRRLNQMEFLSKRCSHETLELSLGYLPETFRKYNKIIIERMFVEIIWYRWTFTDAHIRQKIKQLQSVSFWREQTVLSQIWWYIGLLVFAIYRCIVFRRGAAMPLDWIWRYLKNVPRH